MHLLGDVLRRWSQKGMGARFPARRSARAECHPCLNHMVSADDIVLVSTSFVTMRAIVRINARVLRRQA